MFLQFATFTGGLHHSGDAIVSWLDLHAINIVVIIIIAWVAHRFGANLIGRLLSHTIRTDLYPTKSDRDKRVKTLKSLSRATIKAGVTAIAIIMILGEINPSYATALFASAGLFTVALGFGARDFINDILRGSFIIYENQYRVGDVVEISGTSGTVEEVTIRKTVLRDPDGNVHHVPNGSIIVATNKTFGFSSLNEELVLALDTDVELAEHIINHVGEELAANPDLKNKIKDAPHFTSYNGYGQGGILISIVGTTAAGDKAPVRNEFYRLLHKAFKKQGIQPLLTTATPPNTVVQ
jgi:small-conductance mechanosensitive channel